MPFGRDVVKHIGGVKQIITRRLKEGLFRIVFFLARAMVFFVFCFPLFDHFFMEKLMDALKMDFKATSAWTCHLWRISISFARESAAAAHSLIIFRSNGLRLSCVLSKDETR